MGRIALAFEALEVIAFQQSFGHVRKLQRHLGPFVVGKERHQFARTEVSINDAVGFVRGIRRVAELLAKIAIGGFRGSFNDIALNVVFPAVVNTAQTALFVAAEKKRRAAVGAVLADETDASLSVAKRNQIFAHKLYAYGRAVGGGNFFGEQRRDPVAPDQIAHRRSRIGLE